MRKLIISAIFIFSALPVFGQTQAQPTPNREAEMRRPQRDEEDANRRSEEGFARLGKISDARFRGKLSKEVERNIKDLYRKPTENEIKRLQPRPEDIQKYAAFLAGKKTGIIRLEPYRGCGDSTKIVSASDACLEYKFPGNGSDFSFRERNYRIGRLADLRFGSDTFTSPGVLQQAIFVGIGDVPLENVALNMPGVLFLKNFKPEREAAAVRETSRRFGAGSELDGFYYASGVKALEKMTYVLRSIAYRGTVPRSVAGVIFNELDLDERADVTVAFRIIRKHDSGGVTIIWKELDKRKAPELIMARPAKPSPNRFAKAQYSGKE
ncbi:MAG: hypothetical protein IT174_05370 [Acidobacteria bacterium]|nr:hypothetical protein [Acidobacteriota bacterium]